MKMKKAIALCALLAGVSLFSTVEVTAKVIGVRVLPFQMVFIRFFSTGVIFLGLSLPVLRRWRRPLSLRDYAIFAMNGGIGVALALSLFHMALLVFQKAASCAVVFSANPVFVIIFARFVNNEPWNAGKWTAVALATAGVACFAWESGAFTSRSLGALGVVMLSSMLFALSVCISRRVIGRYGVFLLMGFSALFGSLMVLPFALADVAQHGIDGLAQAWLPVLYIALGGTALAYGLYYFGLRYCTAFQSSMTFFMKPVLASTLAFLLLHEQINRFMIFGSLLILSGMMFMLMSRQELSG